MTTSPPLTGQDIGMAQNATRALLDNLLAGAGTDFSEWVVLRLISQNGGPIGRVALADNLSQGLTLVPADVERLLSRTGARGLIRQDIEGYALTLHGEETYRRLSEEVARLTARIYADFDPDDLATTGRVLREVARKAAALAA
jgi:DNA-binding MarR family transcriptional regulator